MNKMNRVNVLIASTFMLLSACSSKKQLNYHREIKYPESKLIEKIEWTAAPSKYPGTGSDMHWWTIGKDSAVYIIDDDGSNFGGPDTYAHVLKITGVPPKHKVETVTDFTEIPFRKMLPTPLIRRYVDGIMAVDTNLYVTIYDYDWDLERNKPHFDELVKRTNRYQYLIGDEWDKWSKGTASHADSTLIQSMFCADSYSKHYGVAGIIKSTDYGKTWSNIPNSTTPKFLGPKFAGLCFLNFGPGYTQVPSTLSPYVYAISNDSNWESGDHVFMARVHQDSILNRTSWQFLSGFKKDIPQWSSSENASSPIFTDLGHVGHPTISYNKVLNRYILNIFSDMFPHKENTTVEDWKKWDKASELQMYESENPWGPWRIFHNEKNFGGPGHSAYIPSIPNSWWSSDGLSASIMFAGDYTTPGNAYYGLMTQPFTLKLKKK